MVNAVDHHLVIKTLCSYHICGVCGMPGLEFAQVPWMEMVARRPGSGLKYVGRKFRRPPRGPEEVLELPPFCGQCGKLGLESVSVPVVTG